MQSRERYGGKELEARTKGKRLILLKENMTKTMSKTILDKESEHGFYEWLSTTNTFKNLEVGSCKDQAHDGWRAAGRVPV